MRMQWLSALALLGLVLARPLPTRAGEKEATPPVLVARVHSIERVFENARLIARLAGKEEIGRQLEGVIKAKVGPKGLEGIDHKRPLGLYAKIGDDLNDVAAVVMIPISDEKAFLDLLENLNFPAKKGTDGAYAIEPNGPLPVALYFRFAHKYAYFTAINVESINRALLVPPAIIFPARHNAMASLSIRLDMLPKVAKQIALQQVDDAIAREKEKTPTGMTEKQRQMRDKLSDAVGAKIGAVLREGHLLNAQIDIDHATKQLKAEVSLTAKAGSRLAADFEDIGKSASLFGAWVRGENAASFLVHLALPKELRQFIGAALEDGIKQGLAKEQDQGKREQVMHLMKALEPTLKAGELDAALVVRGPYQDKTYTLITGFRLKDGLKVAKVIRGLLKDLPPTERELIKINAETVGDVKVHRIDAQGKYDAQAREIWGDQPIYVAFRPNAVIAVIGHNGLAAIKDALAAEPKASAPIRFQIAVARLAPTFAKTQAQRQALRKAFGPGDAGDLRIAVHGGDGLRLSLTADLSVLQFMAQFYPTLGKVKTEPAAAPTN